MTNSKEIKSGCAIVELDHNDTVTEIRSRCEASGDQPLRGEQDSKRKNYRRLDGEWWCR